MRLRRSDLTKPRLPRIRDRRGEERLFAYNTPAVASYVDPRVVDRCTDGETVTCGTERAVHDLLRDES